MNTIKIQNKTFQIPSQWGELSPAQAKQVFKALTADSVPQLLKVFIRIPAEWWAAMPADIVAEIMQLLDWIHQTPMLTPPIPYFRYQFRWYYLPTAELKSLSCMEFYDAQSALAEKETGKAIAILCREKASDIAYIKKKDDMRKPYNRYEARKRELTFKGLPVWVQYYVLRFVKDSLNHINSTFEFLFRSNSSDSSGYAPEFEYGWMGVFFSVAETAAFGNLDSVLNEFIYDVLFFACKKKDDYLEAKHIAENRK